MEKPSFILRTRQARRAQDRSNPLGLIGFILAALLSIAGAAGLIYGVNRYAVITQDLPTPETLRVLLDPISGTLLAPTRILDRSGQTELWRFENPAAPSRRFIAITDGETLFYSEVPQALILATLAAVDPGYLERPETFLAAFLDREPDPLPAALVEELLLWEEEDSPYHDLRLDLLADQVVARYGREKVLEYYLNSAYYGKSIYGVAQAAVYYFGRDVYDLDLAECALLAAVGRYPALNPLDAPTAAKDNQAVLLDSMADAGFISQEQARSASRQRLIYADPDPGANPAQPALVTYILQDASRAVPAERLLRGGYVITSTLDRDLQHELECTLESMALRISGLEPVLDPGCGSARLLPRYDGPVLAQDQGLEMDLAVLDPAGGELLALAGLHTSGQALSFDQPRPAGTLVTPFIYLNAFTQGFEPASLVWDIPIADSDLGLEDLHPGCSGNCQFSGPVNIRTALVNDLLTPAWRMLSSQGSHQLRSTLGLFGLNDQEGSCTDCASFLEGTELELVAVLQGFGVFANQGYLNGRPGLESPDQVEPAAVLRVEDAAGVEAPLVVLLEQKKIISEELAYLVTDALSDQDAWLDPQVREFYQIGRPAAVKLGYVPDGLSGWTVGYTPSLLVGAWAGLTAEGGSPGMDPVRIASSLWRAITQYAARDGVGAGFEAPPGIITRDVCYPSGELPTEYCPRVVREVFIEGYEPLVPDTLYQAVEINRETGQLASVFTPSERIEERVYLNIPPQAQAWADSAGIDGPPVLYDLEDPGAASRGTRLTSPANLSFVAGLVELTGTIPGEDFVSARLQYGSGLNPRSWLQIGQEITSPVEGGRLGWWDTTGLEDGVYALQLVTIQERQGIEKASLLLSVDNTAPEIILITNLAGGQISFQPGDELLLEVRFQNESEIDLVEFLLDGMSLGSRRVPPFIIPWEITAGEHQLIIRARDQAGNPAELEVAFQAAPGEQSPDP